MEDLGDAEVGPNIRAEGMRRRIELAVFADRAETIDLVRVFRRFYMSTGEISYLDNTIKLAEDLVAISAPSYPIGLPDELVTAGVLDDAILLLSSLLMDRYDHTEELENFERAIKITEEAVASAPLDHPSRVARLNSLGTAYYRRYRRSGKAGDFDQVIRCAGEVVSTTPVGHPNRAFRLIDLSKHLCERYSRFGDLEDLLQAIERAEEAAAATPTSHPNRASILNNLGILFGMKFQKTGVLEGLEEAIKWGVEAVEVASIDDPERPFYLHNLGGHFNLKYQRLGALESLEQAIIRIEEAVAETPDDHPERITELSGLGKLYSNRFERLGDLEDLEKAIKYTKEAVAATPQGHSDRPSYLGSLGSHISQKYNRFGDLQDLEEAIVLIEEAIKETPINHPTKAERLSSLGSLLGTKFQRLGVLEDLEQAIKYATEAVSVTPLGHPYRPSSFTSFCNNVFLRYQRLGAIEDLEKAAELAEEAVAATPLDHPDRAARLTTRGILFGIRFERLGALEDLEKAIRCAEQAIAATPVDHPDRASHLSSLGSHLNRRYKRLGALEDLNHAIARSQEAVAVTPPDHPDLASRMNNLAIHFCNRGQRLGELEDLEQAVKCAQTAVTATPVGHPDRAVRLNNLGSCYGTRYEILEALEDLEQAIKCTEEAVADNITPLDQPDRPIWLSNLASHFNLKYNRLRIPEDLEKAIKWAEEAIAATPIDHPNRAPRLSNLSSHFGTRFERLGGDLEDLEKAVKSAREAVAATPIGHPAQASHLNNFGSQLYRRYKRFEELQDLDKAIMQVEEAVAATPPDHPNRAKVLATLALMLHSRYQKTLSSDDFHRSLRTFCGAWSCNISPPSDRIFGAFQAARLLATEKRWQESSSLLESAVKMLPKLSPRYLGRHDQEYKLSEFGQLAALAASASFEAGAEASDCLRLLELGRGILMGFIMDCRSDLTELQLKFPDAFNKLHHLRTEVDSPFGGAEDDELAHQHRRNQREKAVHELEQTLVDIRQLPGLEGFLLPPSSESLIEIAREGPIVVVNSTEFRSDAIIASSSGIKAVGLPKLVYKEIQERMKEITLELVRGKRSTYGQRNAKMGQCLSWLWDTVVEPILEELRLDTAARVDDTNLPRIWWIGVGALALAPFHAAGDHSTSGSTRNTLSRFRSSYTPTIRALSYARERKLELLSMEDPGPRLLLVTMPTTPGCKPLTNAAEEAKEVIAAVDGRITSTLIESPSVAEVLRKLPSYHAIHFACHGVSNGRNPSNSHLLLLKGDGSTGSGQPGSVDMLTVEAISNTSIKNAQMAYLSACCTAENASIPLADESIHIASGFQLAGFSHVLATMWESNDAACRQVAGEFYGLLFSRREVCKDHNEISNAFHHAVKKLRDENLRQPIKWASFIHVGA